MKLYHSSNVSVEHPDTEHSRSYLDFGRGFYLTSLHEQAEAVRYAQRFKRRGQQAWLNTYEFYCPQYQISGNTYNRPGHAEGILVGGNELLQRRHDKRHRRAYVVTDVHEELYLRLVKLLRMYMLLQS